MVPVKVKFVVSGSENDIEWRLDFVYVSSEVSVFLEVNLLFC